MSSKKKVITIAITTAALSLGGIGIASASNSRISFKAKTSVSHSIGQHLGANFEGHGFVGANGELTSILAGLVTKGILTQTQVDAITTAIAGAHTSEQAQGIAARTALHTLIATTLGIDVVTLDARLTAGDSLATIAGAKTPALIAALVADASTKIDAAVAAGKITATQATTFKANLTAHITAEVNGTGGMSRGMGHMGEGRGHHLGLGINAGGMGSMSLNPMG